MLTYRFTKNNEGMQNMTSVHKEIRVLLLSLANAIRECEDYMDRHDVCICIIGIQNMSLSNEEVVAVIKELR